MKSTTFIQPTFSRRKKVFSITLITAGIIAILLYFEQVEVIYISSTLGLIILLLIVAFADLENVGKEKIEGEKSIETKNQED